MCCRRGRSAPEGGREGRGSSRFQPLWPWDSWARGPESRRNLDSVRRKRTAHRACGDRRPPHTTFPTTSKVCSTAHSRGLVFPGPRARVEHASTLESSHFPFPSGVLIRTAGWPPLQRHRGNGSEPSAAPPFSRGLRLLFQRQVKGSLESGEALLNIPHKPKTYGQSSRDKPVRLIS